MKHTYLLPFAAILIGWTGAFAPAALSQEANAQPAQSSRPLVAEFVRLVLTPHPALAAAQAEVDAATARAEGAARSVYNPEVEAEFEDADSTTKAVGISQAIDWSGKRKARAATGEADVVAATAALEIVKKSVATDLLSALSDHQSAFEQIRLANDRFRLAKDFSSLASQREAAGDLSQSEFLTARLALSQALAAQASAQANLSRTRERLAALSGEQRDVWPLLVGTPDTHLLHAGTAQVNSLPELRFALAKTDGFRSRVLLADKMRKADPTVGLRFGQESNGLGGQETLFGVRVAIPLLIRNNFSQSVTAARAEALGAEAGARNTRRLVTARLNATTERVVASQKAWSQWQDTGATQLGDQRQLLKTLWEAGETDAVSYLVQLNQTFDAEAASIDLKGTLWRSWFEWLDASNTSTSWLEAIQ
ncbi:hypothetical protein MNBD_ALPHA06-31 [hydrothermal vent metagenome]|uniref:Heavy metal RND efflux outer membrane protein, CzcC family n=1 Tax=hydrothermal vent metagenome TaxID=652676 RepID=A0A3B0SFN8_9ZZZZ